MMMITLSTHGYLTFFKFHSPVYDPLFFFVCTEAIATTAQELLDHGDEQRPNDDAFTGCDYVLGGIGYGPAVHVVSGQRGQRRWCCGQRNDVGRRQSRTQEREEPVQLVGKFLRRGR
jgi:hypothetical protein